MQSYEKRRKNAFRIVTAALWALIVVLLIVVGVLVNALLGEPAQETGGDVKPI